MGEGSVTVRYRWRGTARRLQEDEEYQTLEGQTRFARAGMWKVEDPGFCVTYHTEAQFREMFEEVPDD